MRQLMSLSFITALSAAALAGCSANILKIKIDLLPTGERASIIEKLPLTVGVIYNKNFRNYTYKGCMEPATGWTLKSRISPPPCTGDFGVDVNIGEANVALFNRAMHALFAQVETVKSRNPSSQNSQALAAIMEPEILEYGTALHAGWSQSFYAATITYRLVLRTPNGDELARWSISGKAKNTLQEATFIATAVKNVTHSVLRAVEAKMLTGFHEQPGIKRWLSSHGIGKLGLRRNDP